MSTYDDWKTRSDRDDAPEPATDWVCVQCKHEGRKGEDCGCPCCTEPVE